MTLPDQFINLINEMQKKDEVYLKYNEPLSKISSFKIGGNADIIIYPKTVESLLNIISLADNFNIRYDVFGNCTNVLFDDSGYRGALIITNKISAVSIDGNLIHAECGASLMSLSIAAAKAGLSGLEFAYGIPGTVGGAVTMNAGAYGSDISSVLEYSDCISGGTLKRLSNEDHNFGYRKSIYSNSALYLTSATFRLEKSDCGLIRGKMDELMNLRKSKQPLEYPSAGSVFKRYPGFFTAKLIDEAGLKGFSVGGAQVSTKHAGFIINTGNATSSDVKKLIEIIKDKIYERNGINIECEIISVPETIS